MTTQDFIIITKYPNIAQIFPIRQLKDIRLTNEEFIIINQVCQTASRWNAYLGTVGRELDTDGMPSDVTAGSILMDNRNQPLDSACIEFSFSSAQEISIYTTRKKNNILVFRKRKKIATSNIAEIQEILVGLDIEM